MRLVGFYIITKTLRMILPYLYIMTSIDVLFRKLCLEYCEALYSALPLWFVQGFADEKRVFSAMIVLVLPIAIASIVRFFARTKLISRVRKTSVFLLGTSLFSIYPIIGTLRTLNSIIKIPILWNPFFAIVILIVNIALLYREVDDAFRKTCDEIGVPYEDLLKMSIGGTCIFYSLLFSTVFFIIY